MSVVNGSRVLTWTDYKEVDKGKPGPTPNSQISAGTLLTFDVTPTFEYKSTIGNKLKMWVSEASVEVVFDKESWVVKSAKTDALLNHEKGHYRLQALGAKEMYDKIMELKVEGPDGADQIGKLQKAIQALVDTVHDDVDTLNDEVQKLYDSDGPKGTNHGLNTQNQSQWDLKMKAATTLSGLKGQI